MRTKSQNGRRSRTKGHNFERWVVNQLQGVGIACERNIAQSRSAAREGCDIEGTDWWIECGCGNTVDPRAKYAQASEDAAAESLTEWMGDMRAGLGPGPYAKWMRRPVVAITRKDRHEPLVTMCLAELSDMENGMTTSEWDTEGPLVTLRFSDWLELVRPRAVAA